MIETEIYAGDARQPFYVEELPDEIIAAISTANYGAIDPALEALMEQTSESG